VITGTEWWLFASGFSTMRVQYAPTDELDVIHPAVGISLG